MKLALVFCFVVTTAVAASVPFLECPETECHLRVADCIKFKKDADGCVSSVCECEQGINGLGPCMGGQRLAPNPLNCAQYYVCNSDEVVIPGGEPGLRQCHVPYVYDPVKEICQDVKYADCGDRPIPAEVRNFEASTDV